MDINHVIPISQTLELSHMPSDKKKYVNLQSIL